MWAIGADVHKRSTTFYALDDDGEPVDGFNRLFRSVRSNEEGYLEVRRYLDGKEYSILMENSTKTHDVVWTMEGLGIEVLVAHSPDLKKIAKSDKKTDENDARDLAMYLLARLSGADQFNLSYMCSKEDMMARQLCRAAKQEMVDRGKIKRRMRSHALLYGIDIDRLDPTTASGRKRLLELDDPVLDNLVRSMEDNLSRQKALEERLASMFSGNRTFEKIDAIPFFGLITSAYLTSYIGDISRFKDSKAFVASLGLAPRERNSGEKTSHCGITKKGDPHARWLLIQAAIGHVRGCEGSPVTRFFNRKNGGSLSERGEAELTPVMNRQAIVAAAAKMATIIYTLVVKDRDW